MALPDTLPEQALFASAVEAARRKGLLVVNTERPVSRRYHVAGLDLHLLDWQGPSHPPVLLLHGALLQAHVWDLFSLAAREQLHLHALDLPGHGDSGWIDDGDYSRARVANTLNLLVEQLDVSSLLIVGHSFGGAVGALLAARVPERVRGLVMVDSTLLPAGRQTVRSRAAALPSTFASFDEFAHQAAGLRPGGPPRASASLRWNARQLPDGRWTWKYDPAVRVATLGPPDFEDVWTALGAFGGPVLFVRAGEHSHLSDQAATRLQSLSNVELVVVPSAAHNVMTDNPLAFTQVVSAFLRPLVQLP